MNGGGADAIGVLAFGDHGYHLDYLAREDYEPPRSRDEWIAAEREEWLEDHRPAAEFRPPPGTQYRNGGWVTASGMSAVADSIEAFCRSQARCDFAAMLGDNIYPDGATRGVDGHDDATRFERVLREPYGRLTALGPQFRIYAALGNHDWNTSREAALDQVGYLSRTPPFYMDGIAYRVTPTGGRGEVEVFVVDTSVMLAGVTVREDGLAADGRELEQTPVEEPDPWLMPASDEERGMADWLARSLAESRARWKIVLGHHPLWSSGGTKYEQARALRRLILPALCRHADAYLAGHEHTLEVHFDDCSEALPARVVPELPTIVSGAAGKQRGLNSAFMRQQQVRYPQLRTEWARGFVWGFAHLTLVGDDATLRFIEVAGSDPAASRVAYETRFTRRSGIAAGSDGS